MRPHSPRLGSSAPLSEPSPVSSPTTSWSASASVRVPLLRRSSPLITVAALGTSATFFATLVADTTISYLLGACRIVTVSASADAWAVATRSMMSMAGQRPAPIRAFMRSSFRWGELPQTTRGRRLSFEAG